MRFSRDGGSTLITRGVFHFPHHWCLFKDSIQKPWTPRDKDHTGKPGRNWNGNAGLCRCLLRADVPMGR